MLVRLDANVGVAKFVDVLGWEISIQDGWVLK